MNLLFFNTPTWRLIMQTDALSKLIMLGLFVLSVTCVAIIIAKFFAVRLYKASIAHLAQRVQKMSDIKNVPAVAQELHGTFAGTFAHRLVQNTQEIIPTHKQANEIDIEVLQTRFDQAVEDSVAESDSYSAFLGTSAASSTLLGLLGTIWGLIHAFIDISQEKSADIATVAPGIAEALLTTLAGIIVAVPALIFYHYFANESRKIERQLYHIADDILILIRRSSGQ